MTMNKVTVFIKRANSLSALVLLTVLTCLVLTAAKASAASPGPFEQVVTTTFPAAYGELLNIYGESLSSGTPAAVKEISDKLSFYTQAIGRVSGALDIGGKLYLGETQEAAISGGLLVLGEVAGSASGKAYLSAMGLTTLPVTTLITAYQVYQVSASELKKSTIGLKLESLYGMIESDPTLKNRNRDVGVGDPIPVTPEALEYLWRKVLLDNSWRDLFKTYVVEELGKDDWPETGIWSRWTLPGNVIEESEMYNRRDEFKGYIGGLLSYLNRAAKVREQQYVVRKYADELKQKASGMSSASILEKYISAVGKLPEVREFVKNCPARIQQGVNGNDLSPLIQVVNNSKRYAVDVLAWVPTTGKLGTERTSLLENLRKYHDQAWTAREFLQEKRQREALSKAENAKVTVWRASPYGFSLNFADVQGAIIEEFQRTGAIVATKNRIAEQTKNMKKSYDDQVAAARAEFDQAQQLQPPPPERSKEALDQFGLQLSAYRNIDQQLLNDLNEEVGAYVDTLTSQAKLDGEEIVDLSRSIDDLIQLFQTTKWRPGSRNGGIIDIEETLAGYCGDFPSTGYVGLGKLKFPRITFTSGDDVGSFTGRHGSYLESLSRKIGEEARYIPFCGGRAYVPSLISGIDGMVALVDNVAERKGEIAILEEKVLELETILAESTWSSNQRLMGYRVVKLEEKQKPFVKKLRELLNKGESLKGPARSAQQLYQTDLGNMDNDQAYLSQLRLTLGRLGPVLREFATHYPGVSINGLNGTFVFRPEIAAAYKSGKCSALTGRRVFMSASDIRQARQQLDRSLAENRLIWMDQNFNLGLQDFVNMYIADRTGLVRMAAPEHYTFIERQGKCRIITKDYFDKIKPELEKVGKVDFFFERNMEKAVGGDYLGLLSIPRHSYPVNNVTIDLANYPDNGLDFLREVAANCWEDHTRASILGVVTVFSEKLTAFRQWRNAEAHFEQMKERFSEVVGNLSSLEFDAQAAYNKDMYDPIVRSLYQQAAAKESAVMGFLASAVSDPKLSPNRQDFFTRMNTEYKRRFFFIRPWANSQTPSRPKPITEQLVRDFYTQFEEVYESRNESAVMAMISDDWESGDGTTLDDLQGYLHNSFTVFDQITYQISNFKYSWNGSPYGVSYDVTITGRNFRHNLKHEEKSSVNEEVSLDNSGKPRIIRTLNGRFWYVQ
jgi:hypothetical protein